MLSIIIPVYNEAKILAGSIAKLSSTMNAIGRDYEIIIVEDGSTDGTAEVAMRLSSKNVRVLSSTKRVGRGISLSNAISAARGDIVIYMDVDLATNLAYIPRLIEKIEDGAEIATGSRLLRDSKVVGRSFIRSFFSIGYNLLLRLLFGSKIKDHQCGFKAFRKSSIEPMLAEIGDAHWFWDSELLIKAQRKGLKVSEIPVEWTDRKESSVRLYFDVLYMGLAALRLRCSI